MINNNARTTAFPAARAGMGQVADCARPERALGQKAVSMSPPVVYVCSEHLLVQQAISAILEADTAQRLAVCPAPAIPAPLQDSAAAGLVIIDIDSVPCWRDLLPKWTSCGARAIAVISREDVEFSEQTALLNLGACGIVVVSEAFSRELPKAVRSIIQGNLWLNPSVLEEYVKRKNMLLSRIPEARRFTAREEQIISYLIRSLSNRQIGSLLGISERTVKFHVSNILQKAKVESRRALAQLNAGGQTVYMAGG